MIQIGDEETVGFQETDRTRDGVREESAGTRESRGGRE
jgi:hypothetical protein